MVSKFLEAHARIEKDREVAQEIAQKAACSQSRSETPVAVGLSSEPQANAVHSQEESAMHSKEGEEGKDDKYATAEKKDKAEKNDKKNKKEKKDKKDKSDKKGNANEKGEKEKKSTSEEDKGTQEGGHPANSATSAAPQVLPADDLPLAALAKRPPPTSVGTGAAESSAAASAATGASSFAVGEEVLTTAVKFKERYDNKKGVVVKILAQKVRVKLLDGPDSGSSRDYDPANLKKISGSATPTEGSSQKPTSPAGTEPSPKASKKT